MDVSTQTPEKAATIQLDLNNVFMLYATFSGDAERTAHAAGLTPGEVL